VRPPAPADLPGAFSERVASSLVKAEKAISTRTSAGPERPDPTSLPEYREIMLLKVKLELESARILSEAGRLGTELVEAADAVRERAGQVQR
jgi:hypothetical protein